ncbi:hypothetical protein Tco_0494613 [Tanacetum coccineum]
MRALTRVMEKLDHMVKDFHLFEYNKGMETRKWSEDDKRRSKDFITAIEKRLQIRRIYRSLEIFVGGRIRDIDYMLINRTTWQAAPASITRTKRNIESRAIDEHRVNVAFHNEDGNPARANVKQALGYLKDGDGDGNSQRLRYQVNNRMLRHDHTLVMEVMKDLIKGVKSFANSDGMYFFHKCS